MATITGKVETKSRAGTGVKVNGKWYNGAPSVLSVVEWKDEVELEVDGEGKVTSAKKLSNRDSGRSSGPSSSPQQYTDRQNNIEYQSARRDAITTALGLVSNGVVVLPTAKDAKYDAMMGLIDTITMRYFQTAIPERNQEPTE